MKIIQGQLIALIYLQYVNALLTRVPELGSVPNMPVSAFLQKAANLRGQGIVQRGASSLIVALRPKPVNQRAGHFCRSLSKGEWRVEAFSKSVKSSDLRALNTAAESFARGTNECKHNLA